METVPIEIVAGLEMLVVPQCIWKLYKNGLSVRHDPKTKTMLSSVVVSSVPHNHDQVWALFFQPKCTSRLFEKMFGHVSNTTVMLRVGNK